MRPVIPVTQEADGLKYAYGAPKKKNIYMKRAHPNDTLKVELTSIPDSRNLRWPQNIGANGWDNAICD